MKALTDSGLLQLKPGATTLVIKEPRVYVFIYWK